MVDTIKVVAATGGADPAVATDDIAGIHYQKIKAGWGADGTWVETTDTDGIRLPVGGAQLGTLTETAPASDTASSGLNGRLQRIAQRLTSLIALLPAALTTQGSALKVGASESVVTCSVASGQTISAAVDLAGMRNVGLIVPSTFDGTAITFQVSDQLAGTYVPLYDIRNVAVAIPVMAASRAYDLPGELTWVRFLKIVCGTAQATTSTDFLLVART